MFTQCDQCHRTHKVSGAQLRDAQGFVVCRYCGNRFNALIHLADNKPGRYRSRRTERDTDLLRELRGQRNRPAAWWLGGYALLLLMMAQWLYFDGHVLNENPQYYRAWLALCRQLDCQPPLYRQIEDLDIVESDLALDRENNWRLTAVMINRGAFAQAFPRVQLLIQDFSGQTLAERLFLPGEYAADGRLFEPDQSFNVELTITPPASAIAGYQIKLL
jgi:predicted Zn finger-like uncharacterized protein